MVLYIHGRLNVAFIHGRLYMTLSVWYYVDGTCRYISLHVVGYIWSLMYGTVDLFLFKSGILNMVCLHMVFKCARLYKVLSIWSLNRLYFVYGAYRYGLSYIVV